MESSLGALSLNDEADRTLQELLLQLSTQKFQATFLNGKEIEVQYNYDRERYDKDRVKINLQELLPVLGGIMPPDGMKFVSTLGVEDFLKKNLDLHKCSDGMYTLCSDTAVNLDQYGMKCDSEHFHHYCPEHVNAWFKYYLTSVILLREGDYEEVMKLARPQDVDYLTTGDRPTPDYWLRYARGRGCRFSRKTSQELLEQQSTQKFQATFLNGKEIEVQYNYDRERSDKDRVKINLQELLPVLGGIMPPDGMKFVSTLGVEDFLKKNLDLHKCSDGMYTLCSDTAVNLDQYGMKCDSEHFHHYCPEHVNAWFKYYLTSVILLREGDYEEVMKLARPQDVDYLTTGDRPTPDYWLRYARGRGCRFSRKTSQELLEQQSTHKFQATFLNGKKIEVEYTYDQKKLHRGRVKINLECLSPILGGLMPSDGMKFVSTFDVKDFLKTKLDLHKCMDGIFSPCSNLDGNLQKNSDECPNNHFHHYCAEHVNAWFRFYLTTAILLRQGDYADLVKLAKPQQAVEMTTGDRPTPEYWLGYAQRKGCGFPRQ